MHNLNLDHLRTLMTVVELGSFSAAARRVNLSQPAVSLQIPKLAAVSGCSSVPGKACGRHRPETT
jgi:hypothetical protein